MSIDEYEAIQAEFRLKAKLDMVETKKKPNHGRPPRKIGVMTCSTGVRSGYRDATTSFVLRLDSDTGEFIAEHGDMWYVSKSRDALKARMEQVAVVVLDLKWARYLLIDYQATVPGTSYRHQHYRGTTTLDVGDRRDIDGAVLGVCLTWKIVEYSDVIAVPGEGHRFMRRDVDEKGEPSGTLESCAILPVVGLVPYTKAREEVLLKLRAALAAIDARMVELFCGGWAVIGRKLDELLTVNFLLDVHGRNPPAAPASSKKPKKKG